MSDTSHLFFRAAEYLQKVKSLCQPFNPARIEFYKELQKDIDERTVPLIEVEAAEADGLAGLEISIFGTDPDDLKELGTVRKKVYLSATETQGQEAEYVFPAKITQVGQLNSSNPTAGRIDFSPRRFAFRIGRRFPELLRRQVIDRSVIERARYYVTLELQRPDPNIEFEYPRGRVAAWEVADEEQSPLIHRLELGDFAIL
jgi:hypothetical protein